MKCVLSVSVAKNNSSGNERTPIRSKSIYLMTRLRLGISDDDWSWVMMCNLTWGDIGPVARFGVSVKIWGWWPGKLALCFVALAIRMELAPPVSVET